LAQARMKESIIFAIHPEKNIMMKVFIVLFLLLGVHENASALRIIDGGSDSTTSRSGLKGLVTTAYYTAKSKLGNKEQSDEHYKSQMGLSMGLNSDMVIYGDNRSLEVMTQARGQQKPLVGKVQMEIEMLPPCSTVSELYQNEKHYTHETHVPSIQLGCIWSGKLTEMVQSMKDHPDYPWYIWIDVGFHDKAARKLLEQHGDKQWPDPVKLEQLPNDKMIVAYSDMSACDRCVGWEYCHCVSGMTYAVPAKLLQQMQKLFSQHQFQCLESTQDMKSAFPCMSDQVILTRIVQSYPHLFHFVAGRGYGAPADAMSLFKNPQRHDSDLVDFLSN